MTITIQDIESIAALARLKLSPDEKEKLTVITGMGIFNYVQPDKD